MVAGISLVAVISPFFLAGLTAWLLDAVGRSAWQFVRTGRVAAPQARTMMVRTLLALGLYVGWTVLAEVAGAPVHALERVWLALN